MDLLSENVEENKGILIKLDENFEVVEQFIYKVAKSSRLMTVI